jgi:hypothetical protein
LESPLLADLRTTFSMLAIDVEMSRGYCGPWSHL